MNLKEGCTVSNIAEETINKLEVHNIKHVKQRTLAKQWLICLSVIPFGSVTRSVNIPASNDSKVADICMITMLNLNKHCSIIEHTVLVDGR